MWGSIHRRSFGVWNPTLIDFVHTPMYTTRIINLDHIFFIILFLKHSFSWCVCVLFCFLCLAFRFLYHVPSAYRIDWFCVVSLHFTSIPFHWSLTSILQTTRDNLKKIVANGRQLRQRLELVLHLSRPVGSVLFPRDQARILVMGWGQCGRGRFLLRIRPDLEAPSKHALHSFEFHCHCCSVSS